MLFCRRRWFGPWRRWRRWPGPWRRRWRWIRLWWQRWHVHVNRWRNRHGRRLQPQHWRWQQQPVSLLFDVQWLPPLLNEEQHLSSLPSNRCPVCSSQFHSRKFESCETTSQCTQKVSGIKPPPNPHAMHCNTCPKTAELLEMKYNCNTAYVTGDSITCQRVTKPKCKCEVQIKCFMPNMCSYAFSLCLF